MICAPSAAIFHRGVPCTLRDAVLLTGEIQLIEAHKTASLDKAQPSNSLEQGSISSFSKSSNLIILISL